MTEPLLVNRLRELLPLSMWQLLHAGLVSELDVPIDIALNRKDNEGRYVRLAVLAESEHINPFCAHLRKSEAVNRTCMKCQCNSLDRFVESDRFRRSNRNGPLPHMVTHCHVGLFRIIYPLRVHGCIVAFIVVHALRQAGNEGLVMYRLLTLPHLEDIRDLHRIGFHLQMALPQLSEVRGFSPKAWSELNRRLTKLVGITESRLQDAYNDKSANSNDLFLAYLFGLFPDPVTLTEKRLVESMGKIAEEICKFCNVAWFVYCRRPRQGERIRILGSHGLPRNVQDLVESGGARSFDCPPLPVQDSRPARPLQLLDHEQDWKELKGQPWFEALRAAWETTSRTYIHPQRAKGIDARYGAVNDLLFFGPIADANRSLVESKDSKRIAFEQITQHLGVRLDAFYRIIDQQKFIAEMSHEMSAPTNAMLVEMSYIVSKHKAMFGRQLPSDIQYSFDLLRYYVKYLDHKRRNWLHSYGEGQPKMRLARHRLGDILQEVVNLYTAVARREGIVFKRQFSYLDLPTLEVDREWIDCVFANLVDNAIKYTGIAGFPLFRVGDVKPAFINGLLTGQDAISVYLKDRILGKRDDLVFGYRNVGFSEYLQTEIVEKLNELVVGPPLSRTRLFCDLTLRRETRQLLERAERSNSGIEENERMWLNKFLLEDAFPGDLGRQRYIDIEIDDSDSDWFCVSVSNFGFGIRQEWIDQGLIFQEGWRLPREEIPETKIGERLADQRYVTGTGIGCSVVKRFMEAHDGRVEVESRKGRYPETEPVNERFWTGCKTTFTVAFRKPK